MSAILGTYLFDLWNGPAPPPTKSTVELIYRPGQAIAAAKILPNQSTGSDFEAVRNCALANAHTIADSYRASIGTVLALTYLGQSYGSVLVQDVTVTDIRYLIGARGVHPNGTPYNYSPAAQVTSRWSIVRLG